MFLPGVSHEDSNGASSSSFFVPFSPPVDSIQAFRVSLPFSSFQGFLMAVQFLIVHLSLFYCPGVLKISQKARLVFQDQFNLFRGCYLIQAI